MDAKLNRWTGQPHAHERERQRRLRHERDRLLKQLAIAEVARASAIHLFPELDLEDQARKFAALRERLRTS